MPVNPVAAAGSAGTADVPTTSMSGPNALLDRDAFLKLLVAQLKYQDPTNPTDASQMVTQSSQLTMVDRLNEIATQLGTSAASQRISLASSVVGKSVTFPDADGISHTAVVSAARLDGDEVMLTAGTWSVPMGAVTTIVASPAATAVHDANASATTPTTPTTTAPDAREPA
jgi:flagellar basal-body rod modification protein FlgD